MTSHRTSVFKSKITRVHPFLKTIAMPRMRAIHFDHRTMFFIRNIWALTKCTQFHMWPWTLKFLRNRRWFFNFRNCWYFFCCNIRRSSFKTWWHFRTRRCFSFRNCCSCCLGNFRMSRHRFSNKLNRSRRIHHSRIHRTIHRRIHHSRIYSRIHLRIHICCLIGMNNCPWRDGSPSNSSWWIGRHALFFRFKRSTKGRQRNANSLRIVVHWSNKCSDCTIFCGWNNRPASVVLSFSHPSWLPSQLQGTTVQSIFCQKSCSISNHGTNTIPMCLLNFDSI